MVKGIMRVARQGDEFVIVTVLLKPGSEEGFVRVLPQCRYKEPELALQEILRTADAYVIDNNYDAAQICFEALEAFEMDGPVDLFANVPPQGTVLRLVCKPVEVPDLLGEFLERRQRSREH